MRSSGKSSIWCPDVIPGSLKEAVELAEFLRDLGYMPEQVQILSDPRRPYPPVCIIQVLMVNVAVNPHEKAMQRALTVPESEELRRCPGKRRKDRSDRIWSIRPRQGEYKTMGTQYARKKGRTDQKPALIQTERT